MNNLQRIANLYRDLLILIGAMILMVIAIFPEPFSLLRDPVSWLGKTGPGSGFAVYRSFWLFSAALIFITFKWYQIIAVVAQSPIWQKLYVRLAFLAVLAGFLLMLFPCDRFDPIHSTGGALVGIGMWIISSMMLFRLGRMFNRFVETSLHVMLHSSALYCIIHFSLDTPLKGFSQRPAILAIVLVTTICLHWHSKALQKGNSSDDEAVTDLLNS
ncbi:MAG: hypothetical protein FJ152_08845 [Firmicutes bacterium]|nr:hypothetical protein [Bacillota bacterium]